jgi:peptidoglycan hydrolase FlgJ
VSAIGPVTGAKPADAHAQLREASRALEAVFLTQLLQAMRESIPDGGVTERSAGEQMFTTMLDEKIAQAGAGRNGRGISEALYRQLSRLLPPETGAPEGPTGVRPS